MIQIETTQTELKLASHKVNFRFPKASYSYTKSSNRDSNVKPHNIFLYLRNVTYYIRIKYNSYQLSFSLKTAYKKIAVRKLKEIELLINLLNQYSPELTEQDIKNQIKELINDELNYYSVGLLDENHEKLEAQYNAYDDYTSELKEIIAKEPLTTHKLNYLNQHIKTYNALKNRLNGNPEPLLNIYNNLDKVNQIETDNKVVTIAELCDLYIKEKERKWSNSSKLSNKGYAEAIIEIFDYLNINDINQTSREDFIRVKETILKYPKNRKQIYKQMPLKDILKSDNVKKLSIESSNHYITFLHAVISGAHKSIKIKHNLAFDLKLQDKTKVSAKRNAFTVEQCKTIIEHCQHDKDYLQNPTKEGWRLYVPYLGMITGARLNEICQLQNKDIITDDKSGITYIDINREGLDRHKRLKNKDSPRLVPLVDGAFGFSLNDFLMYTKSRGDKNNLLFDLPYKQKGGYGDKVSKWFNRNLLVKAGIKNNKLSFHSLRHTVTTLLKHNNVPEHITDQITGHAIQGISYGRYGKDNDLEQLYQYLKESLSKVV